MRVPAEHRILRHGAYAEYAVADERYVVPVPDAVLSRDAAPLTCAGVTIKALGGADVAVALAVAPDSFGQAFRTLSRGGRMVCVSQPADGVLQVPIFDTVLGDISIIGSIVGTRQDLADVFSLHAAGRSRIVAESRKLDEINTCFTEVLAGQVPARLVIEF